MKRHLSFTLALVVACLVGTSVFGATINVPSASYPTIQAGIDAAAVGDTVLVADGIYAGSGNKDLDFKGKAITVKSESGPEKCIIDGERNGRGAYFHTNESRYSVLDGFTIRNCNKSGILVEECDPTINNCIITGNTPSIAGDPNSPDGGGILVSGHPSWHASPLIKNCTIRNNFGGRSGGGIAVYECSPTIQNCDVSFNEAGQGGGMILYTGSPIITNCTITGNASSYSAGGVSIDQYFGDVGPVITNSVIWGNSPDNVHEYRGTGIITYCNIQGGWAGEGNINADPLFVDPISDLHLKELSPCINAGNNNAPSLPSTDKDGLPRIVDGTVDMGAYEFQVPVTLPAVLGCSNLKGVPLRGVEVQLQQKPHDTQTAVSDANGCYQFENVVTKKRFDILIKGPVVTE